MKALTRRQALRLAAGAGVAHDAAGQQSPIEVDVTLVSARTVRITAQPQALAPDGALVRENWGQPAVRRRFFAGSRRVKSGELSVTILAAPLTIRVEEAGGRTVQELRVQDGKIAFRLGDRPVLGLG